MDAQLAQLKDFHTKFDPTWHETPTLVSDDVRALRVRLMREEMEEAIEAMEEENLEHIAKEISDVLYAVYGTIGSYGLASKMTEIFNENHKSQMSKDVPEGGTGKAVKGDTYKEADIISILQK